MRSVTELTRDPMGQGSGRAGSLIWLAGAAVVLLLSACKTTGVSDEVALTAPLAPMAKPVSKPGETRYWLRDGEKEIISTTVAVNGEMVSGKNSEGCQWTEMSWGFAPSAEWSGCAPFTDGAQNISGVEGEIWPLEVGKSVSYSFSGSDKSGDSWNGTRRCSVEAATRVKTVSGEHDTYKVVCQDPWTDRVWYVSPALEEAVYFERYRKTRNERMKQELIKVEMAAPAS